MPETALINQRIIYDTTNGLYLKRAIFQKKSTELTVLNSLSSVYCVN